jgi:hypothetical protein
MSLTARVAPPRYLLGQALHAEWTKFRTVAGALFLGTLLKSRDA